MLVSDGGGGRGRGGGKTRERCIEHRTRSNHNSSKERQWEYTSRDQAGMKHIGR